MSNLDRISSFLKEELYDLLCGRKLGEGAARAVFEHALDPTLVIKFEAGGSFQNVIEWETWQSVQHVPDIAKWFAPCIAISPNGAVLVQRRTTPAAFHPERVPAFFTDLKCANFGILIPNHLDTCQRTGQFVCHDYGTHLMLENGMTKRMRKADWWNL